jgi:hypothetical protein
MERTIREKGDDGKFQDGETGVMDIAGDLDMESIEKEIFRQPRGAAIKKNYP